MFRVMHGYKMQCKHVVRCKSNEICIHIFIRRLGRLRVDVQSNTISRSLHFTLIQICFTSLIFWGVKAWIIGCQWKANTSRIRSLSCEGKSCRIWGIPWLRLFQNALCCFISKKFCFQVKRMFSRGHWIYRIYNHICWGLFAKFDKFFGLLHTFSSCLYLFHCLFVLLYHQSDLNAHLRAERVHHFSHFLNEGLFVSELRWGNLQSFNWNKLYSRRKSQLNSKYCPNLSLNSMRLCFNLLTCKLGNLKGILTQVG